MIDLSEHLGLIPHVIKSMSLPVHMHDEAFSEGLVIMAVASTKFDPGMGVPPGAYLAQRLRWGLKSWQHREMKQLTVELSDRLSLPMSHEEEIQARRDLDQLLYVAARRLNAPEYVALLGAVYGARQNELANILGKNAQQLEALRMSAREKLRNSLRLL